MRRALVVPLVTLALLAGCVTNGVKPAAVHETPSAADASLKVIKERAFLPVKDGTKLDNWVFRPDTSEKVPVLIQSRPYFGNLDPTSESGGQKFSKWLVEYFVPRGYAVVLHSIRGTGQSEGCYDQGGVQEQKDEAETVEQFAAMPWSNGKVASIGKSYGGTTPWEAALQQPPHLATIVPIEGITDWYDYLWTPHGVNYGNEPFNTRYTATISYDLPPGSAPPAFDKYAGKVCERQAELTLAGTNFLTTNDKDAWWQERDFAKQISKINEANISVYIVHGLQDWNVKPSQVVDVYNQLTVPKRLVLGQQDHQYPLRADWGDDLLRWFDQFLKGKDTGILQTPPVMVSDSDGKWRLEDSWPPLRATLTSYQLGADGKLVADGAKTGEVKWFNVPGNAPRGATTSTPERVVWLTAPLDAPLRISGAPTLRANASFLAPPHDRLAVTLFVVNDSGWHDITWAAGDARHHKGAERPEIVAPGQVVDFVLPFEPVEQLVPAGAKLALVFAGETAMTGPATPGGAQIVAGPTAVLTLPTIEADPVLESPQPVMKKPDELPWTS